MEILGFTWNYIVVFLIVLTILVFVHEYGHYWVAKRNGVRVEAFSVGFGPEIWGRNDASGTRWKICVIPLGGYVKMFGEGGDVSEDGEKSELSDAEKAVSFYYKTVSQRAAIVAAGPIVNFIFAIFAFAILAGAVGNAVPLAAVGKVFKDSAAEIAGFKSGDRFISINEEEINLFSDLRRIVTENPDTVLSFQIDRAGKEITLSATPKLTVQKNAEGEEIEIGLLGVEWSPDFVSYERQNPAMALWVGVQRTYMVTTNILSYIGDMFSGRRGTDELGGPLRIAQISGQMAEQGIGAVILLMAMLSVNLGLINLFPIPMLDGGHLAFYLIEALLGRPLGAKAQEYGFRFGLILVLMLVVFVTWNDLVHLEVIEFIKGLIT
ncbi:MAG: RIP metalloprotease RseP [Rhodospirillales bacterium]|jgi:regulator of sigma E protease|tara:strand:+ start:133 stop:1269 length:1137 start_codon:yes stop_codon:yes gene_type:complete